MIDMLKSIKIPESILFSSDNKEHIVTDFMKEKFPDLMRSTTIKWGKPIQLPDNTKHPRPSKETIEAIKYNNELCEKPQEELLVLREKARAAKDAVYFDSKVDFEHWGKMSVWTIEQSIALLLGMNPEIVNWNVIKERLYSPKAIKFKQYMELANSDLKISNITGMKTENLPTYFLKWAADHDVKIPPKLQNAVDKYHKWIDWKEKYEQEKMRADAIQKEFQAKLSEQNDNIKSPKRVSTYSFILSVLLQKTYPKSFRKESDDADKNKGHHEIAASILIDAKEHFEKMLDQDSIASAIEDAKKYYKDKSKQKPK